MQEQQTPLSAHIVRWLPPPSQKRMPVFPEAFLNHSSSGPAWGERRLSGEQPRARGTVLRTERCSESLYTEQGDPFLVGFQNTAAQFIPLSGQGLEELLSEEIELTRKNDPQILTLKEPSWKASLLLCHFTAMPAKQLGLTSAQIALSASVLSLDGQLWILPHRTKPLA